MPIQTCGFAAATTKVVAQPGTVTGRIGVAYGKWNRSGWYRRRGVNLETVSVGRNVDMQSEVEDHTESQAELVNKMIDRWVTALGYVSKSACKRSNLVLVRQK